MSKQSPQSDTKPGLRERLWNTLRAKILTGIVVLVPMVVTFLVLRLVFQWLDGLAQPLIKRVFQVQGDIPGLGIALTLLVIWLAGLVASNVAGHRLIGFGHDFMARLPIIGNIYSPVRQFIEKIVTPRETGFSQVVLAEYPSEGLWILGFATGEMQLDDNGTIGRCVFVPTSPNPVTGWMVIFPPEKVRETPLTVEAAMQLIVSAGVVIPPELRHLGAYGLSTEQAQKIVDLSRARSSENTTSSQANS